MCSQCGVAVAESSPVRTRPQPLRWQPLKPQRPRRRSSLLPKVPHRHNRLLPRLRPRQRLRSPLSTHPLHSQKSHQLSLSRHMRHRPRGSRQVLSTWQPPQSHLRRSHLRHHLLRHRRSMLPNLLPNRKPASRRLGPRQRQLATMTCAHQQMQQTHEPLRQQPGDTRQQPQGSQTNHQALWPSQSETCSSMLPTSASVGCHRPRSSTS